MAPVLFTLKFGNMAYTHSVSDLGTRKHGLNDIVQQVSDTV